MLIIIYLLQFVKLHYLYIINCVLNQFDGDLAKNVRNPAITSYCKNSTNILYYTQSLGGKK